MDIDTMQKMITAEGRGNRAGAIHTPIVEYGIVAGAIIFTG
jgi:hypothetical protein